MTTALFGTRLSHFAHIYIAPIQMAAGIELRITLRKFIGRAKAIGDDGTGETCLTAF